MTLITEAFVNPYAWLGWWALYSVLSVPVLMLLAWGLMHWDKTELIGLICALLTYPAIAVFLFSIAGIALTQGPYVGMLETDITELGFKDVDWLNSDQKFTATLDDEPVECALFDTKVETEFKVVCVVIEAS